MDNNNEIVFVVEACQNPHWSTRHDEKKYEDFFKRLAGEII
jgi:hypothetical protein